MKIISILASYLVSFFSLFIEKKIPACVISEREIYGIPSRRDLNRETFIPVLKTIIEDIVNKLKKHALLEGIDSKPFGCSVELNYSAEALIFLLFEIQRSFNDQGYTYAGDFNKETRILKITLQ